MIESVTPRAFSSTEEIIMIAGMMLVTFGVRYPLIALAGRVRIPPAIARALNYVPVAVLTAISVPLVLKPEGSWALGFDNAYLVGSVVAVLIAWFSRNLLLTILGGMLVFFFWRLVLVG